MSLATARTKPGHGNYICYNVFVNTAAEITPDEIWGPYPNYDDIARFQYGRLLWRSPVMRSRLLRHWTDPRHPHGERFAKQRVLLEEVLASTESPAQLDQRLRARSLSLRTVAREIPPVFGSFF
jgi:hypothetical protein